MTLTPPQLSDITTSRDTTGEARWTISTFPTHDASVCSLDTVHGSAYLILRWITEAVDCRLV